jgi:undecaprenyl-diphosphatase
MTTDPPLVFFWLLSMLLMHWAFQSASGPAWVLLGLSLGLGILSKYTMAVFFLPALALLLTSPARRQLRTPWPYLAVILCLALAIPLVVWNYRHGWMNFFHNIGQTHSSKGSLISLASLAEFVGSQMGIVSPLLLPMMLCFWYFVLPFALFLMKSLHGRVLANWALVCYLPGLISFSAYFLPPQSALNLRLRHLGRMAVNVAVGCTIVLHLVCFLPFPRGLDPLTKVRRGSAGLGQTVGKLSEELQSRRFIFSDNYMTASLLAFYVDGRPHTYCVNLGRRVNEFDVWPTFHDLLHYDAVLVLKGDCAMPKPLQDRFADYQKCLVRTLSAVGGIENTYSVFLCRDFRGMEKIVPTRYN